MCLLFLKHTFPYLPLFSATIPELLLSPPPDCNVFSSYSILLETEVIFPVNLYPSAQDLLKIVLPLREKERRVLTTKREFLLLNTKHPADNVSRLLKSCLKRN